MRFNKNKVVSKDQHKLDTESDDNLAKKEFELFPLELKPITEYKNILQEAYELVTKDRQESYGHPVEDMDTIAKFWSLYTGCDIKAHQVPVMQMLAKISRSMNSYNEDNARDWAGYALIYNIIQESTARNGKTD